MGAKVTGSSSYSVSPTSTPLALTVPTMSPATASSMVTRSRPNSSCAKRRVMGRLGPGIDDRHAPPEATAGDAQERDPVAMTRVGVGLDLEHEARERCVDGSWHAIRIAEPRRGARERPPRTPRAAAAPPGWSGRCRSTRVSGDRPGQPRRSSASPAWSSSSSSSSVSCQSPGGHPAGAPSAMTGWTRSAPALAPWAVRWTETTTPCCRSMSPE